MNDEVKTAHDVAGPAAYGWITYLWVIALAAWGGLVRFLNTMRKNPRSWSDAMIHLSIGLVTSVFVGLVTFFLCESMGVDQLLTAAMVAATGHMGAEGIKVFEEGIKARLRAMLPGGKP